MSNLSFSVKKENVFDFQFVNEKVKSAVALIYDGKQLLGTGFAIASANSTAITSNKLCTTFQHLLVNKSTPYHKTLNPLRQNLVAVFKGNLDNIQVDLQIPPYNRMSSVYNTIILDMVDTQTNNSYNTSFFLRIGNPRIIKENTPIFIPTKFDENTSGYGYTPSTLQTAINYVGLQETILSEKTIALSTNGLPIIATSGTSVSCIGMYSDAQGNTLQSSVNIERFFTSFSSFFNIFATRLDLTNINIQGNKQSVEGLIVTDVFGESQLQPHDIIVGYGIASDSLQSIRYPGSLFVSEIDASGVYIQYYRPVDELTGIPITLPFKSAPTSQQFKEYDFVKTILIDASEIDDNVVLKQFDRSHSTNGATGQEFRELVSAIGRGHHDQLDFAENINDIQELARVLPDTYFNVYSVARAIERVIDESTARTFIDTHSINSEVVFTLTPSRSKYASQIIQNLHQASIKDRFQAMVAELNQLSFSAEVLHGLNNVVTIILFKMKINLPDVNFFTYTSESIKIYHINGLPADDTNPSSTEIVLPFTENNKNTLIKISTILKQLAKQQGKITTSDLSTIETIFIPLLQKADNFINRSDQSKLFRILNTYEQQYFRISESIELPSITSFIKTWKDLRSYYVIKIRNSTLETYPQVFESLKDYLNVTDDAQALSEKIDSIKHISKILEANIKGEVNYDSIEKNIQRIREFFFSTVYFCMVNTVVKIGAKYQDQLTLEFAARKISIVPKDSYFAFPLSTIKLLAQLDISLSENLDENIKHFAFRNSTRNLLIDSQHTSAKDTLFDERVENVMESFRSFGTAFLQPMYRSFQVKLNRIFGTTHIQAYNSFYKSKYFKDTFRSDRTALKALYVRTFSFGLLENFVQNLKEFLDYHEQLNNIKIKLISLRQNYYETFKLCDDLDTSREIIDDVRLQLYPSTSEYDEFVSRVDNTSYIHIYDNKAELEGIFQDLKTEHNNEINTMNANRNSALAQYSFTLPVTTVSNGVNHRDLLVTNELAAKAFAGVNQYFNSIFSEEYREAAIQQYISHHVQKATYYIETATTDSSNSYFVVDDFEYPALMFYRNYTYSFNGSKAGLIKFYRDAELTSEINISDITNVSFSDVSENNIYYASDNIIGNQIVLQDGTDTNIQYSYKTFLETYYGVQFVVESTIQSEIDNILQQVQQHNLQHEQDVSGIYPNVTLEADGINHLDLWQIIKETIDFLGSSRTNLTVRDNLVRRYPDTGYQIHRLYDSYVDDKSLFVQTHYGISSAEFDETKFQSLLVILSNDLTFKQSLGIKHIYSSNNSNATNMDYYYLNASHIISNLLKNEFDLLNNQKLSREKAFQTFYSQMTLSDMNIFNDYFENGVNVIGDVFDISGNPSTQDIDKYVSFSDSYKNTLEFTQRVSSIFKQNISDLTDIQLANIVQLYFEYADDDTLTLEYQTQQPVSIQNEFGDGVFYTNMLHTDYIYLITTLQYGEYKLYRNIPSTVNVAMNYSYTISYTSNVEDGELPAPTTRLVLIHDDYQKYYLETLGSGCVSVESSFIYKLYKY